MTSRPALLLAIAALSGCETGPRVEVSWTGADTGHAVLPATARRCGAGPVELLATSGDTGIGITLYGEVPLATGTYAIADPNQAASAPPAAALAARWIDSIEVMGFRSLDGSLELGAVDPLEASFTVRASRWSGGSGEVTLTGSIHDVGVGPCSPRGGAK